MRRRLLTTCLVVSGVVGTSCSVESVTTPLPTGPSELAISLVLSATPDVIRQDGTAQSTIQVLARDAFAQPMAGLSLRLETLANGLLVDFGVLSSKTMITGSDGRASVTYVAPGPPPPAAQSDVLVTIRAIPIGTNYASAQARTVDIRLTRPGVILPPNGTPQPSFFASPSASAENEPVFFDASASRDDGQIVSYVWNFGDGEEGTGRLRSHTYKLAGTYSVTLTVTDDRGLSASTAPASHTVQPAANPVAAFTISPTNPRVGTSIVFNAAISSVATGRQIVAWDWEFGDGHQATGVAPIHTFTAASTFTVVLTVTDNTGRKGVTSTTVVVQPPTEELP
ncbi:MAG: PKD domain-containing protein [Acidobacteria bacterium]|nr:PKD domain-containing protein [Acidobacteriota bacterium]